MFRFFVALATLAVLLAAVSVARAAVPRWSVHEISLSAARSYDDLLQAAPVTATFRGPSGVTKTVRGFWDGDKTFKIRFTPTALGAWAYTTVSPDAGLHNQRGAFACVGPAKNSHGFVRRDPARPYHFAYDDGTPCFLFGQTYYGLLDRDRADWTQSVDGTRRRGMNKIRFHVPANGKNAPDLARLRKLDDVVAYLNAKGVIADLLVLGSGFFHDDEKDDEAFVRYVLARYAAYPNVAWTLVNEWNYRPKPRDYWNALGKIADADDPWSREGAAKRMLSVHQQTRFDFEFFDQRWLSHAIVQVGVRNGQKVSNENELSYKGPQTGTRLAHGDAWGHRSVTFNLGHDLPVVNDEYGYIGEPEDKSEGGKEPWPRLTRVKHRNIIWGIYCAGGYASAGDKYDYPSPKGGSEPNRPYKTGYWQDVAEYGDIERLVRFFTTKGLDFGKMAAHNDLKTSDDGGERVYVLAEPGRQYVVYAAAGGSFGLTLAPGTYAARRYDPRTGEDTALADVTASQSAPGAPFTLPAGGEDWVVYLQIKG